MDQAVEARGHRALVLCDDDALVGLAALLGRAGIDCTAGSWSAPRERGDVPSLAVVRDDGAAAVPSLVAGLRRDGARVLVQTADPSLARARDLYVAGADVVVADPVDPDRIALQCCALLQLWHPDSRPAQVGRARFDAASRRLMLADGTVRLTEAEAKILSMLLDGRSGFVSRDSISRSVFHVPYDRFDRRIDVHVSNLRRKLRENGVGATVDTSRLNGLRLLAAPPEDAGLELPATRVKSAK